MFTRSAKRVTASVSEGNDYDNYTMNASTKTEIKSRRKQMKENMTKDCLLDNNKRLNYVSYPTDDESTVNEKCVILDTNKKAKKNKSSEIVLKEVNPNHSDSDGIVERKVKRLTRQHKHKNESNKEGTLLESVMESKIGEADIESVITKKKVKKNSKKTKRNKKANNGSVSEDLTAEIEHVTENNKKAKKKKKGKLSNTTEGKKSNSKLEKSSASIDSFHSAAGSPDIADECGNIANFNVSKSEETEILNKTNDLEIIGKTHKYEAMNTHDDSKSKSNINEINEKSSTRVKLSVKTDINDTLSPIAPKATLEVAKSKDKLKSNTSADYENSCNRRKSSVRNVIQDSLAPNFKDETFDKCNDDSIVSKLNGSYNGIDIVCTQFNKSNVSVNDHETTKKQGKTRKLSITNHSINTVSLEPKTEIFDKCNTEEDIPLKCSAIKQRYSTRLSKCDTIADENLSKKIETAIVQDNKDSKLDVTFEKSSEKTSGKSSLISSDGTLNVTFDKSDLSRVSITSDESRTEHIVNTSPVLIESSLDASDLQNTSRKASLSKKPQPAAILLKREGTFTKDGPGMMSPKEKQNLETPNKQSSVTPKKSLEQTPTRRMSVGTPGSTPFPFSKSSQKKSVNLNVTRSIEKQTRRSSLATTTTRTTRVMFCSPLDNPVPNTEAKRKIVKSNLKGSNKSFVFDDSISATRSTPAPLGRKRSYTHDESQSAKRSRIGEDAPAAALRLSRSRTFSASGKLSSTPTPAALTPSKVSRTKLPNFAAVHQRRFDKMESLSECQQRKARRAQQLLAASGAADGPGMTAAESAKKLVREPSARKSELKTKTKAESLLKVVAKPKPTTSAALPTLDAVSKGYTRFGFRMNIGVNPFSNTADDKKEKPLASVPKPVFSQTRVPLRKETAQQIIMGQKPSLSKRSETKRIENRMHIKGVRTNRRFELQMKMRGVDG